MTDESLETPRENSDAVGQTSYARMELKEDETIPTRRSMLWKKSRRLRRGLAAAVVAGAGSLIALKAYIGPLPGSMGQYPGKLSDSVREYNVFREYPEWGQRAYNFGHWFDSTFFDRSYQYYPQIFLLPSALTAATAGALSYMFWKPKEKRARITRNETAVQ